MKMDRRLNMNVMTFTIRKVGCWKLGLIKVRLSNQKLTQRPETIWITINPYAAPPLVFAALDHECPSLSRKFYDPLT